MFDESWRWWDKSIVWNMFVEGWWWSDGSIVWDMFENAGVFYIMAVLAIWISTATHKVKKTDDWDFQLFFVWVSAVFVWELALADWIEYTWVISESMFVFALPSCWTVVLEI